MRKVKNIIMIILVSAFTLINLGAYNIKDFFKGNLLYSEYEKSEYTYSKYEEALVSDEALREVLREIVYIEFNEKEITEDNLRKIKKINGRDRGIKSIKGLELCKEVEEIDLSNNNISNVEPLKKLGKLKNVNLEEQKIEINIKLEKEELFKKGNVIINENVFKGIDIFSFGQGKYTSMKMNDDLSQISFEVKKNLEFGQSDKTKFEHDFKISDDSFNISGTMETAFIYYVQDDIIKDQNLKKIIEETVEKEKKKEDEKEKQSEEKNKKKKVNEKEKNKVVEEKKLTMVDLELITELNGDNKRIFYLDGIENLKNLNTLSLNKNKLQNIDNLSEMNLKTLNLSENKIESLEKVYTITNLENLDASKNNIRSLGKINKLENLKTLNLSQNSLRNGDKLKSLEWLESLDISNNYIKEGLFLKSLVNLKYLNLEGNGISDIEFIKDLKLKTVNFKNQKINIAIDATVIKKGDVIQVDNIFKNEKGEFLVFNFEDKELNIQTLENGNMEITLKKDLDLEKTYNLKFDHKFENGEFSGKIKVKFADARDKTMIYLGRTIGSILIISILLVICRMFIKKDLSKKIK